MIRKIYYILRKSIIVNPIEISSILVSTYNAIDLLAHILFNKLSLF